MKCPYCAEEINDEARLCRFCGARLLDGRWQPPDAPAAAGRPGRNFTMLTTGWLLLLSGAWMLATCTATVPLLGEARSGAVAMLYNGAFGALFLAMGYALAWRKPWALAATAAATACYTIDKLLFIFDAAARHAYYAHSEQLTSLSMLLGSEGDGILQALDRVMVQMSWGFLAGWWGLAVYVYIKRSYFKPVTQQRSS